MARSVSEAAGAALMLLLAVAAAVLLYLWVSQSAAPPGGTGERLAAVKIDSVSAGNGYIMLYVRCVAGPCVIDSVYVEAGGRAERLPLQPPLALPQGGTAAVPVPFLQLSTGPRTRMRILLSGPRTRAEVEVAASPVSTLPATIGLLAARDVSCSVGDRRADAGQLHWLYINLVTGSYRFRYVQGATVRDAEGKARLVTSSNVLDLSSMTRSERYRLGPVVVFINPFRAARPYQVRVRTIYGKDFVFDLNPLTGGPDRVVFDALVLWEDLWWPGTGASLDNYVDHVIRATMFANSTLRVEVMHASGCYLHMFMYRAGGLPGFEDVPRIVEYYATHGYREPPGAGIVYVKTHGATVPPLGGSDIWDPARGRWLNTWPVVLTIKG